MGEELAKTLILDNLIDTKTGKHIVLDLSDSTLPFRYQLKKFGDYARHRAKINKEVKT